LSYLANTQTDKQTDKVWQKHYLLGGGNKTAAWKSETTPTSSYAISVTLVWHQKLWNIRKVWPKYCIGIKLLLTARILYV